MRRFSFLALLLLCSLLTSCQKEEGNSGAMSEEGEVLTSVETTTVTTTSFTRTRAYVGNVSAAKQVKVIPLASERILEYPWENGDYVKQGEMIARIRNEVSKKGLDALNAQIKSVEAQLKAAEREAARVKSMYESNIVSRQNYDQATDGVTTLKATMQQLLANQEQTKLGLDYAKVVAPISGVISNKNSEVGDIASSAMPLCILNDLETLKVTLNVNEGDTPYLSLGQEVQVRFDAFPGEIVMAKITRIMPYVNSSTRTNTVEAEFPNVKLDNGQYKYKPGMYSRAELGLQTTNDALVIPPTAAILEPELLLKQVSGQTLRRIYVLASQPDANGITTAEGREIEIGEYAGEVVEVLSGLKPGDQLIVRGHHSLQNGDKVKVIKSTVQQLPAPAVPPAPVAVPAPDAAPAEAEAPAQDAAPAEAEAPAQDAKKADKKADKKTDKKADK